MADSFSVMAGSFSVMAGSDRPSIARRAASGSALPCPACLVPPRRESPYSVDAACRGAVLLLRPRGRPLPARSCQPANRTCNPAGAADRWSGVRESGERAAAEGADDGREVGPRPGNRHRVQAQRRVPPSRAIGTPYGYHRHGHTQRPFHPRAIPGGRAGPGGVARRILPRLYASLRGVSVARPCSSLHPPRSGRRPLPRAPQFPGRPAMYSRYHPARPRPAFDRFGRLSTLLPGHDRSRLYRPAPR